MTNLVSFPGLGLSFELSRVAFTLFGFPIYWYGVLIGGGMMLAVLFAFSKARSFGVDIDRMVDVIFIGFVLAIVCGRLYYVVFIDTSYKTFFELVDLRSGGIAIYGGIIGACVGAVIGCKWRKVPVLPMLDLTSMGFLIGQSIGRWGNFFNQEAFGVNSDGILRMISPATTEYLYYNQQKLADAGIYVDPQLPVHPTFFYESVWCAIGFFLLWAYSSRRRFNGEIALMYVMWYGVGRFFIEGLRTDSLMIFGMRVSQLLALASAVAALVVWLVCRGHTKGKPLTVPQLPPRTATVKLDGPDGPQKVTISWPADQKAPDKAAQVQIAMKVLAAQQAAGENDAADGQEEKPQPESRPEPESALEPKTESESKPELEAERQPAPPPPPKESEKDD